MPPSAFDNALAIAAQRQQLGEQANLRRQLLMQQMMQRQQLEQEREYWKNYRQQQSPGMLRYNQQAEEEKAVANYVLGLDSSRVEPQWRYMLQRTQDAMKQSPQFGGAVAKNFMAKYRPMGVQFKQVQTFEYDDDGNLVPVTSLIAVDPMSRSAGPVGLAPGMAVPSRASEPPAAAPKPPSKSFAGGSGLEIPSVGASALPPSSRALLDKYRSP